MRGWRGVLSLLRQTFDDWQEDRASRLAAAIAYYTAFSLAPLLIVVISVAGLAFGREAAQGEIVRQIQGLVGHDAAKWIEDIIEGFLFGAEFTRCGRRDRERTNAAHTPCQPTNRQLTSFGIRA